MRMTKSFYESFYLLINHAKCKIFTKLLSPVFFSVGEKIIINPPLRFFNLQEIQLGNRVIIQSNCWLQALPGDTKEISPKLIIGDYSAIGMDGSISAAKKIVIDEHVIIGRNVFISDHSHEYTDIEKPIMDQGICNIAGVHICKNTWLGQNSVIMPGVTIGRNCVIGANSLVNMDIPDYSIAVGVPARLVKRYNKITKQWEKVKYIE
jgi:acetyltransferase-like isoleucine patch superfamily enzyme